MSLLIREAPFGSADFDTCFSIRLAVFVEEQNVPLAEERDALDATARHFLALLHGAPAGTARLLMKDGWAKITRVAVLRPARGQRVGEALMRHAEAAAPVRRYMLDAQTQALPFYQRLGYQPMGEQFLEAGIPHFHMRKEIPQPA